MKKIRTRCCQCGKNIVVHAPKSLNMTDGFTCNNCVPVNSAARDGINESPYTEYVGILAKIKNKIKEMRWSNGHKAICHTEA